MKTLIKNFIRNEDGAAAAEYALLLAIVAAGVALAAFQLGDAVDGALDAAETCVDAVSTQTVATTTQCGNAD